MNKKRMNYLQKSKPIKLGPIRTSSVELVDILKGWVALSFAFALILAPRFLGTSISVLRPNSLSVIFTIDFVIITFISLFTVGIGFLLHELAHKFVAQYYGCIAEFRSFDRMILLAVGLAATVGFIFAAPGAVMISGTVTRKENGIISIAGPATNFVLAILFIILFFNTSTTIWISNALFVGASVNAWLGLFNLIPFGNFDGKKILMWSKFWWTASVVVGVGLLFFL